MDRQSNVKDNLLKFVHTTKMLTCISLNFGSGSELWPLLLSAAVSCLEITTAVLVF